ncbi:MAG: 50S ribosomal protein L4 [Planctomycetota bacterium]|nr:50S ribosomal protein L4 [Planctomycetota bacterium]MDA0932882.1 50S ribosomal protein L4 [Planctomycetota bacterium]MDA1221144.1 50S ribosomal protein L4 [Planctomycetota bacterium]
MAEVKVYSGGKVSAQEVDASLFGDKALVRTMKDAVVMYEANVRQGTAKTKTRAEVAGPNKKLWKQKHTGRARMGSKKVVHWRGGGTAFGPVPRDYSYQMPKKARRVALRNAVFTKFRDGEVCVADGWPTEAPSTKQAFSILEALGVTRSALVVTAERDTVVYKSLRNVPHVSVCPVGDLNAREVLLRRNMVLTPAAMDQIKERLGVAAS